ncbi:DUF2316 family protein [Listeria sp. PSOL-1]|uniref:DUF2316 family protein n=1 Tax=Listeria sp. PSOL-1 TaxID=1844999 RepID=UPI0013D0BF73|nr:DUF2316 family protein [Listeria sp. PSOL-1]
MSLTFAQRQNTIQELKKSLEISGLTIAEVANQLDTHENNIHSILHLKTNSLEDPWILKEFLTTQIIKQGKMPVTFTALVGDFHHYPFLNSKKIEQLQLL